jgi:hypothetical protein
VKYTEFPYFAAYIPLEGTTIIDKKSKSPHISSNACDDTKDDSLSKE